MRGNNKSNCSKLHINKINMNKISVSSSIKTILIIFLTTLIGILLDTLNFNKSSVVLIFILGVLLISINTNGYIYGIIASILGVLLFNFFLIEPYFTLYIYEPDYIITFLVMLISALTVGTLTSKLKREMNISSKNEKDIRILYNINQDLLRSKNYDDILDACASGLAKIINKSTLVAIIEENFINKKTLIYPEHEKLDLFDYGLDKLIFKEISNKNEIGNFCIQYKNYKICNYPIIGTSKILGIVSVLCLNDDQLNTNDIILIESILIQVAFAIEREELYKKSEQATLSAEKERIRGNLLRSISHDLRTPLSGIIGSSSAIIENYVQFKDEIKLELLNNIYEDANWLSRSVENIISITKVNDGMLKINKDLEVVDEIISESVSIIKKYTNNHKINIYLPQEILLIYADGLLIQKVLVNLVDNAIRHTPDNTYINIRAKHVDKYIQFEVEDSGGGISDGDHKKIFEQFYSKSSLSKTEKRGIGLGLSICKSIVKSHDGSIEVFNNDIGGSTFRFSIPCWEG